MRQIPNRKKECLLRLQNKRIRWMMVYVYLLLEFIVNIFIQTRNVYVC